MTRHRPIPISRRRAPLFALVSFSAFPCPGSAGRRRRARGGRREPDQAAPEVAPTVATTRLPRPWPLHHATGWQLRGGERRRLQGSKICALGGRCHEEDGECVARDDADCQASLACTSMDRCTARGGGCVVRTATKPAPAPPPPRGLPRVGPGRPPAGARASASSPKVTTSWNDGLPSSLTYYPDQPIPDSYYLDTDRATS